MQNLILASTSTVHGQSYLEYLKPTLERFFSGVEELLFIPYARPGGITHDAYTNHASRFFETLKINVKGLHQFEDPKAAIAAAQGIFTGGGNTFVLVKALHELGLMAALREQLFIGTPYLGTSAGSNICGINMQTTNDMPIAYPPSFKTLGMIPCNINPHYLDPIAGSTHMGETRETRINEFHSQVNIPVIGLREGSWLEVHGKAISLKGAHTARLFRQGQQPTELETNTQITSYF
ncbi:dipeptidase PepE [Gilvibacter sediminis]|uniref:dipeptidase PepE n=1 Tax=Gilvibacter sediminis TaxID=379071 RepID=UPI002350F8DC|nr:dipeptidase PepE [Gilvibacter sediminis]MDC7998566.1 dipeptidase PepE [Gilvibacter sediminis]